MANHPTTELWHVICRGGWDFSSHTTTFEYLLQLVVTLSVGGRALCGAPNSRNKLYPPTLLPVQNEDTREILEVLKYRLFDIGYNAGPLDDHLRSTCLASILMHLQQMIDDFSDQHRIVQRIIKISSKLSILSSLLTIDDLLKWGDIIREHWKLENATVATANIHMLSSQVSSLEGRLIVTQEHVKTLTKELTATNEHIKQLSAMMKDVVRFTKSQEIRISSRFSSTSPNSTIEESSPGSVSKRRKSNEINNGLGILVDEIKEVNNTISAQEIQVDAQTVKTAETILRGKAAPTIHSLKNLTLQDMLVNWFEFEIYRSSDLHCVNRTIRDKVRTSMKFVMETVLTTDDRVQLREKCPPEDQPLQYTIWRNQLRSKAHSISERAFKTLEEMELNVFGEKKTSRASNITSLYDRLIAVKQKQEEAQPKVGSASIEQYFR